MVAFWPPPTTAETVFTVSVASLLGAVRAEANGFSVVAKGDDDGGLKVKDYGAVPMATG